MKEAIYSKNCMEPILLRYSSAHPVTMKANDMGLIVLVNALMIE